jgi:hypothetical protein
MVALGHRTCCGSARTRRVRPVMLANPAVCSFDEPSGHPDPIGPVSSAALATRTAHTAATR